MPALESFHCFRAIHFFPEIADEETKHICADELKQLLGEIANHNRIHGKQRFLQNKQQHNLTADSLPITKNSRKDIRADLSGWV
mmetsp:Transcript_16155/g.29294  ORF Transcript_16155/g.29294 Transcript_16155/m.29294 type:complete len:84 (-) Transcript_16155:938-1189(-)